jgi:pimeloyl-ACP methyl ester carboxylesterase
MPLDAWRALAIPVLLLGGETSPAPVRAINDLLALVLPRCASVVLPGIGHMGPMTHPEEVRQWLPEDVADEVSAAASTAKATPAAALA